MPPTSRPAVPVNQHEGKLDVCLSPQQGRCQFRDLPLTVAVDFVHFPGQE